MVLLNYLLWSCKWGTLVAGSTDSFKANKSHFMSIRCRHLCLCCIMLFLHLHFHLHWFAGSLEWLLVCLNVYIVDLVKMSIILLFTPVVMYVLYCFMSRVFSVFKLILLLFTFDNKLLFLSAIRIWNCI